MAIEVQDRRSLIVTENAILGGDHLSPMWVSGSDAASEIRAQFAHQHSGANRRSGDAA